MINGKVIYSYALLGLRAAVLHPLRKLFGAGGDGKERFLQNYAPEGLVPLTPAERDRLQSFSRCIHCGLCDLVCPSAGWKAGARLQGPSLVALAYARATPDLPRARAAVEALDRCPGCSGAERACERVCPRGVPIRELLAFAKRKLAEVDAWKEKRR